MYYGATEETETTKAEEVIFSGLKTTYSSVVQITNSILHHLLNKKGIFYAIAIKLLFPI